MTKHPEPLTRTEIVMNEAIDKRSKLRQKHDDLLVACNLALEIRQLSFNVDANPKIDILERKQMARKLIKIENTIKLAIDKAQGGAA